MASSDSASLKFVPPSKSLAKVREASKRCTACHLYAHATQTVFGEGSKAAKIMFVGEQPGDQEDIQGKPFVGPAGRILSKALEDLGIDRNQAYVTNAVKHFKFRREGKRRIHEKPNGVEIKACRGWLEKEMELVEPKIIVCLGATASQALLGNQFRVLKSRGKLFDFGPNTKILATYHPSALLRAPHENYKRMYQELLEDLEQIKMFIR